MRRKLIYFCGKHGCYIRCNTYKSALIMKAQDEELEIVARLEEIPEEVNIAPLQKANRIKLG